MQKSCCQCHIALLLDYTFVIYHIVILKLFLGKVYFVFLGKVHFVTNLGCLPCLKKRKDKCILHGQTQQESLQQPSCATTLSLSPKQKPSGIPAQCTCRLPECSTAWWSCHEMQRQSDDCQRRMQHSSHLSHDQQTDGSFCSWNQQITRSLQDLNLKETAFSDLVKKLF